MLQHTMHSLYFHHWWVCDCILSQHKIWSHQNHFQNQPQYYRLNVQLKVRSHSVFYFFRHTIYSLLSLRLPLLCWYFRFGFKRIIVTTPWAFWHQDFIKVYFLLCWYNLLARIRNSFYYTIEFILWSIHRWNLVHWLTLRLICLGLLFIKSDPWFVKFTCIWASSVYMA